MNMPTCVHSRRVCSARRLATLAKMREAKARLRIERIEAGWNPEPRMSRAYPIEIGFRDRRSGETAWVPLKSARQAKRLARRMLQEWEPTPVQLRFPAGSARESNPNHPSSVSSCGG
jgi:uncharacterized protein (DUF2344 family)